MSDINNERLFHFANPNGCWHEKIRSAKTGEIICKHCKESGYNVLNPSYSTFPPDRERLLLYLMGKEEMWKAFKTAILTAKIGEPYDTDLIVYLFSFIDGAPRWVGLLSDWLGMESTREKWGWEECQYKKEWPRTKPDGESTFFCELECNKKDIPSCNGTGKIQAEWAKEV